MNRLFLIIYAVGCYGCVTTAFDPYIGIYNEAVAKGKSVTILKEKDFKEANKDVNRHLLHVGYKYVIYSNQEEGFLVLAKRIPVTQSMLIGDSYPYKIIVKYTKLTISQTKIDFANGSTLIWARGDVDKDIRTLSGLITAD